MNPDINFFNKMLKNERKKNNENAKSIDTVLS